MERLAESVRGRLEVFYYAFGDDYLFAIWDIPDYVTVAAVSMIFDASGPANAKVTVLLTSDEIDQATKKTFEYSPPGE